MGTESLKSADPKPPRSKLGGTAAFCVAVFR